MMQVSGHSHHSMHKRDNMCEMCAAWCLFPAAAAMRAMDEIKSKQREDYSRLTVLGDTLAFEADHP